MAETASQKSGRGIPAPKTAEKAKDEPTLSDTQRQNLLAIREIANQKRLSLWKKAQFRSGRRKSINVASGCLALISGGSAAALLIPVANLISLKLMTAGLAFISGTISLITNTFFDDRETSQIYEGAGAYGELRDRVGVILNKPGLTAAEAHTAYERFTDQSSKLAKDYDQLLDAGAMDEITTQAQSELEKYKEITKQGELRESKPGPGGYTSSGGGIVFVNPTMAHPSGPTTFYTPIHRD